MVNAGGGWSVLAGIEHAAHEEDGTGGLVAQEVEEGTVGREDELGRRRGAGGVHGDSRGGRMTVIRKESDSDAASFAGCGHQTK
jgi:hypothetical protein